MSTSEDPCDEETLKIVFKEATLHVKRITSDLTEEQLFEFYGYYKQARMGNCMKSKPMWFQVVAKQKWKSWMALRDMGKKEAMIKYIELLNSIAGDWPCLSIQKPAVWVHHSSMENKEPKIPDSEKTVFDWVKENNVGKVEALLDTGVNVNDLDENKLTLLHWAADRGNLDMVKCLVEKFHADVNKQDGDGQIPLHYASFCGHEKVVKFLLESGTDPTIKDCDGNKPSDVAHNSRMKKLIKKFQKM